MVKQVPMTAYQRLLVSEALHRRYNAIFMGGARGTLKTAGLASALTCCALAVPETYHLALRRVMWAAEMNLGREFERVFQRFGLPLGKNSRGEIQYSTTDKEYRFPNGSKIILGYCKDERDWERYQGLELATVGIEEVTQFPEAAWDKVGGSSRSGTAHMRGLKIATGNPGGTGHEWVKRRLIDEKTRDRRTLCILSKLRDSYPMYDIDPGYALRVLRPLSPALRKQWEDGDWGAVEGSFWNLNNLRIEDVDVPPWASVYCGVDPGFWPSAYAACWVAVWREDGETNVHVLRDLKAYKRVPPEQARLSKEIEEELPIPVASRWADPQAWADDRESKAPGGQRTALAWSRAGFPCNAAPKLHRADGWNVLRTLMATGRFSVSPEAKALIVEMQSAQHDEKSDDILEGSKYHVSDALRYVVNAVLITLTKQDQGKDNEHSKPIIRGGAIYRNGRWISAEMIATR